MDCDNTKCTKSAHSRCKYVLLSSVGIFNESRSLAQKYHAK
jgi:hypothetical protein